MQLNVSEKSYIDIKKISSIKTFIYKIGEYKILNEQLDGVIELDISYFDSNNNDIFIKKEIPFSIIINNDTKINNIEVKSCNIEVIDNWGINCYYELLLDICDEKCELNPIINEIDIPFKEEREIIKEDNVIEEIKEENINDNIEENIIEDIIEESSNVEIISTKSNLNEFDFINYFNSKENKYSYLKTIKIKNESELDIISKKYNVSISDLYKGYDKENNVLVFITNENN